MKQKCKGIVQQSWGYMKPDLPYIQSYFYRQIERQDMQLWRYIVGLSQSEQFIVKLDPLIRQLDETNEGLLFSEELLSIFCEFSALHWDILAVSFIAGLEDYLEENIDLEQEIAWLSFFEQLKEKSIALNMALVPE